MFYTQTLAFKELGALSPMPAKTSKAKLFVGLSSVRRGCTILQFVVAIQTRDERVKVT